jgi:hypothetical protein
VPALDAPALSHQAQQFFWRGAQAGDKAVGGPERLAIAVACRDHFRDPTGAMPVGLDVLRRFFRPQIPADVTSVTELVIGCDERDLALSEQLVGDLPVERLLVGLDRQQEVGPLLRELPKNACCVCSASAWMSTLRWPESVVFPALAINQALASATVANSSVLKHSSLNRLLNKSAKRFCHGEPGSI